MNALLLPLQLLAVAMRPAPFAPTPHSAAPPALSAPASQSSRAAPAAEVKPEDEALAEGCGGGDEEDSEPAVNAPAR